MHSPVFFSAGLATLAGAAPLVTIRDDSNYFQISKFNYDGAHHPDYAWSFDVAVVGKFAHHPAVNNPVTCVGNIGDGSYVACTDVSGTQSISAFITGASSNLRLQYEVITNSARYDYYGHAHVKSADSEDPTPKEFQVDESRVAAVA